MPPPSKHQASEPKRALKVKEKAEAAKMRGASEPVYSGPTLPPLTPGERAEVEADMASDSLPLILLQCWTNS